MYYSREKRPECISGINQCDSGFLSVFAYSSRCERARSCGGVLSFLVKGAQNCGDTRLLREFVERLQSVVVVSF